MEEAYQNAGVLLSTRKWNCLAMNMYLPWDREQGSESNLEIAKAVHSYHRPEVVFSSFAKGRKCFWFSFSLPLCFTFFLLLLVFLFNRHDFIVT